MKYNYLPLSVGNNERYNPSLGFPEDYIVIDSKLNADFLTLLNTIYTTHSACHRQASQTFISMMETLGDNWKLIFNQKPKHYLDMAAYVKLDINESLLILANLDEDCVWNDE